ncbi:mechanosensitive ion channel [Aliifodinibius sp. S!AR15-10]|uniref:mechanosensitive ion channel family protein n=1 Tax=Aliifodinibius sp. S!AR15-10 TaxID=2950437 RepID=UPI00285E3775|nr:mechanosensitive ion channel domain-containing protein [Aliifodinibius sp. S!AR15-10]MDR8391313.1 mechanosensitive ion channel [Aliifodinibius sp. S!AR15-10]
MTWTDILEYINKILNFVLFRINETPVTVMSVFVFFLFITAFIILGVMVRKTLNRRILRRFKIDEGTSYTLSRISQYTIITIGALISFQFIGIDLSGLAVIFGLLSVGIGFGLQNVTSNFISGLIILFERPISIGDRVMVGDIEGDVIEINIRSTKIRTLNNISIIVPNSEFVSQDVINYSHGDPTFRVDIEVGVSYSSDLEIVLQCLHKVADENEHVQKKPEPQVHLTSFGDSAWNMQLRAWIADVKNHPRVRNELNQAIVHKFRENKVEIPFPQRDLHMRSSVELPIKPQDDKEAHD